MIRHRGRRPSPSCCEQRTQVKINLYRNYLCDCARGDDRELNLLDKAVVCGETGKAFAKISFKWLSQVSQYCPRREGGGVEIADNAVGGPDVRLVDVDDLDIGKRRLGKTLLMQGD